MRINQIEPSRHVAIIVFRFSHCVHYIIYNYYTLCFVTIQLTCPRDSDNRMHVREQIIYYYIIAYRTRVHPYNGY